MIVLSYLAVRKNFGLSAGLFALPFIWVTFEWLYALGQFAFPWLTLGNTQTYQLGNIQFAEITGVYGISFWLVVLNVLFFSLLDECGCRAKGKAAVESEHRLVAAIIAVVYLLPGLYSLTVDETTISSPAMPPLRVGIVQPNIDPWSKWEGCEHSRRPRRTSRTIIWHDAASRKRRGCK